MKRLIVMMSMILAAATGGAEGEIHHPGPAFHGVETGVQFGADRYVTAVYQLSYEPEYRFLAGCSVHAGSDGFSAPCRNSIFFGYRRFLLDNLFLEYHGNLYLPVAASDYTCAGYDAGGVWSDVIAGVTMHSSSLPVYGRVQYLVSFDAATGRASGAGAIRPGHWNRVTLAVEIAAGYEW